MNSTLTLSEMRRALTRYTPFREIVGVYEGDYKVFDLVAPGNATPPYLIVNWVPNNSLTGVYGDNTVMEAFFVQFTAWARELHEATHLADAADDAILASDFSMGDYEVVSLRRATNPLPLFDSDSTLYGVVVRYELVLAR
jgi:hypothetical protein